MKVHLQMSNNTPENSVSHAEQSVDVCPNGHLLNLACRIIYNSVPWPVIQGSTGPKTHQVVHKPIAHAWPSTHTSPGLWQHYADGAWSPPHTPCMPSSVWLVLWVWTVNKALTQSAPAESSNHPHWKKNEKSTLWGRGGQQRFLFLCISDKKGKWRMWW